LGIVTKLERRGDAHDGAAGNTVTSNTEAGVIIETTAMGLMGVGVIPKKESSGTFGT